MSQKQVKKTASDEGPKKAEVKPVDKEKAKKLGVDMDRLISEIDDILEKNSEEFVKSYVQKGGE